TWTGRLDSVRSITAAELKAGKADDAEVLDVRKPGEWEISHLKEARFIPLADMPSNVTMLDKHNTYVVYCGGGYRSMTAISLMRREGFTDLINVSGGFNAMVTAGLEIETEGVLN
ncbi:MAG: rhodanese-like domain-containing protein, partial [Cyclobacteriaceae bacterium]|nr:rhodanese-like domain-containing protein [Cyclobacteriaceae bacterium]